MANPRRASLQSHPHILPLSTSSSSSSSSLLNSLSLFLKRPQAFPFLLSIFVLLTWLSLRYSSSSSHFHESKLHRNLDLDANLVRLSTSVKDERGWIVNPVSLALENGIHGGAQICASIHAGEIRAGRTRGNHRHHTCNETFIIWGAEIKFRLENPKVEGRDYSEVSVGAHEVAIAASPAGTAHALINVDLVRSAFFVGCQDSVINYNSSATDFHVWKDI